MSTRAAKGLLIGIDGFNLNRLDAVLETIVARESYGREDWLILLTTDHGHRPEGGHGGQTDAERSTFLIGVGEALDDELAKTGRMVDIAPTLLAHVGVAADPGWALDGRSLLGA
jgi:arylsulfatase A-like enzyme